MPSVKFDDTIEATNSNFLIELDINGGENLEKIDAFPSTVINWIEEIFHSVSPDYNLIRPIDFIGNSSNSKNDY